MENIVDQVFNFLPIVLQGLGALVILATAIVRLTPNKNDDLAIESIANKVFKLFSYLPTIGVNPRTKKLEEVYSDLMGSGKADDKSDN